MTYVVHQEKIRNKQKFQQLHGFVSSKGDMKRQRPQEYLQIHKVHLI